MGPVINSGENLEAYRRQLDGVAYSTYVLVMLIVPLKLWCRTRAGGWSNIGLDDYMTIIALIPVNGFFWTCMISMKPLLGVHVAELPDPLMVIDFLRSIWIIQLFYTFGIACIKFAVLAFYWRLFSVHARMAIWIVAGMCIAWFVAIFFCVIFSCIPLQAAWDITIIGAKCIPIRPIYIGGSVPNVVLDVIVVFMPIPYVWRLHASLAQRLILAGMFILGTFIAIVSLVRLIVFLQIPINTSGDVTFNFRQIILWTILELNVGLTCACLPSLKPAFGLIGLSKIFSFGGSRVSDVRSPGPHNGHPSHRFGSIGESRKHQPRKKGSTGGLFSTIGGRTRLDSEEDLEILNDGQGKKEPGIKMMQLSDNSETDKREMSNDMGINVERRWSISVDKRSNNSTSGLV